jgi:hypothetical protein
MGALRRVKTKRRTRYVPPLIYLFFSHKNEFHKPGRKELKEGKGEGKKSPHTSLRPEN